MILTHPKRTMLPWRGLLTAILLGGWLVATGSSNARGQAADAARPERKELEQPRSDVKSADREAAAAPGADREGESADRAGSIFRITLPITGETSERVRRFVLGATEEVASGVRPLLIFEFHVRPDQEDFARGSQFGASYELARLLSGEATSQATTVAFVPESIQGHAVLAAIACEWIVMGGEAEIGRAGIAEGAITPAVFAAYEEIASRRKKIPREVALGLLDPSRRVLEVETETSREYVTPEGLDELAARLTIEGEPTVLFEAGEPGRLTGKQARDLDFIDYLASERRGLARALRLPPQALQEDPSLTEPWRWARLDLKGPIDARAVDEAQVQIEQAIRRWDVNFVCLWIDSPGGSLADSLQLAHFLAFDLDPGEVRTVAFVDNEALADAALVALACDRVVMHPEARLGGAGAAVFSEMEIDQAVESVREALSVKTSRSWSLPAAMIDPNLEVSQYTRLGEFAYSGYFCERERADQPESDDWKKGPRVSTPGEPFQVEGRRAVDYRLADELAGDLAAVEQLFGLEAEPILLRAGWAHVLVDLLAQWPVALVVLVVGFGAVWFELHTPGLGIGGFVALVCFLLFFWSRFLGGTAGWLEVMLFLAGVACLLLEVFVLPGFGIFGLGGGLLILVSLVLASQTFVLPGNAWQVTKLRDSVLMIAGAGIGVMVMGALVNRWLPNVPVLGGLLLRPPSEEEVEDLGRRESLVHFEDLLGARGTTTTQLTPGGKARFGDRLVNVIADGEVIPPGTEIVVQEVRGNRVLVRAASDQT
jgi:membrane-bound ClpP family serine protease